MKLFYNQNWNIGFCEITPDSLIHNKRLPEVQWMKHPYRDRWFADPYLLKITKTEIVVLVEECIINAPKGTICELIVDKATKQLKERRLILELDTHLSYPAIIWHKGNVYVYPENGASGSLNIYEYDEVAHTLINPTCILNEAVADANIIEVNGHYYMSATKYPNTQADAYLYEADTLFGPYRQIGEKPYQTDKGFSRQGGNWFVVNEFLFRPVQDCRVRYGASMNIMEVKLSKGHIDESPIFSILPCSSRYSEGLHTINFLNDYCVIDSCGYSYPMMKYIHKTGQVLKSIIK